jgi:hypothetical protein
VTRDFGNGRLNQLTAIGYTTRFLEACNAFDRAAVAAETKTH